MAGGRVAAATRRRDFEQVANAHHARSACPELQTHPLRLQRGRPLCKTHPLRLQRGCLLCKTHPLQLQRGRPGLQTHPLQLQRDCPLCETPPPRALGPYTASGSPESSAALPELVRSRVKKLSTKASLSGKSNRSRECIAL